MRVLGMFSANERKEVIDRRVLVWVGTRRRYIGAMFVTVVSGFLFIAGSVAYMLLYASHWTVYLVAPGVCFIAGYWFVYAHLVLLMAVRGVYMKGEADDGHGPQPG